MKKALIWIMAAVLLLGLAGCGGKQTGADARKKARANEERIVQDAMAEAGRIVDNANREAELSKQKVANEVKEEIVSVAGAMAGKLVAASLDEETQNKLLDYTLKEMGDDTWLS